MAQARREFIIEIQSRFQVSHYWLSVPPPYHDWEEKVEEEWELESNLLYNTKLRGN